MGHFTEVNGLSRTWSNSFVFITTQLARQQSVYGFSLA